MLQAGLPIEVMILRSHGLDRTSSLIFLAPDLADHARLSFHRPRDAIELACNLFVGPSFQFPESHLPKLVIVQLVQEALNLLGHLRGEVRRRLWTDDLFEVSCRRSVAAAFLAAFVFGQTPGFASGEHDEDLPEIFAIGKLRKPALFRSATETVERAQGDVFLIVEARLVALELLAGQADQALGIAFPEWLSGGGVAGLQQADSLGHRVGRIHGRSLP
jgi:hypothetical protein